LDVLLSRPEVDPTRVGMTGNSGGGTLSEWIWANEPRLTMCAPSCHVTSFLTNLENELPTDAEQCPPGVIGAGLRWSI
jgi:dipeptidyl aminopeptidase/acylaminoacyl peptidase